MNDLKYDLMVLNQDLSKIVPSSKLSEELLSRRVSLQEVISKLEHELEAKPEVKPEDARSTVKKVEDEEGQVRIWSSTT